MSVSPQSVGIVIGQTSLAKNQKVPHHQAEQERPRQPNDDIPRREDGPRGDQGHLSDTNPKQDKSQQFASIQRGGRIIIDAGKRRQDPGRDQQRQFAVLCRGHREFS